MKAKQVLTEMLVENTGRAMCDSGGVMADDGTVTQGYGRNWEINRDKNLATFEAENEVTLHFDDDGNVEYYTISVFHYLARQFDIDATCERFNKINTTADDWDDDRFYGVSKEAGQLLDELGELWIQDTFNSYNGETSLSQVIQGTHITIDERFYIILQIHGGCDIRGGYTTARLFVLDNDYGCLAPEDVYGIFTPNKADLDTPILPGVQVLVKDVAGVIEFSNCYDGYTLNRIHNDWSEFELNQNRGTIIVGLH